MKKNANENYNFPPIYGRLRWKHMQPKFQWTGKWKLQFPTHLSRRPGAPPPTSLLAAMTSVGADQREREWESEREKEASIVGRARFSPPQPPPLSGQIGEGATACERQRDQREGVRGTARGGLSDRCTGETKTEGDRRTGEAETDAPEIGAGAAFVVPDLRDGRVWAIEGPRRGRVRARAARAWAREGDRVERDGWVGWARAGTLKGSKV